VSALEIDSFTNVFTLSPLLAQISHEAPMYSFRGNKHCITTDSVRRFVFGSSQLNESVADTAPNPVTIPVLNISWVSKFNKNGRTVRGTIPIYHTGGSAANVTTPILLAQYRSWAKSTPLYTVGSSCLYCRAHYKLQYGVGSIKFRSLKALNSFIIPAILVCTQTNISKSSERKARLDHSTMVLYVHESWLYNFTSDKSCQHDFCSLALFSPKSFHVGQTESLEWAGNYAAHMLQQGDVPTKKRSLIKLWWSSEIMMLWTPVRSKRRRGTIQKIRGMG